MLLDLTEHSSALFSTLFNSFVSFKLLLMTFLKLKQISNAVIMNDEDELHTLLNHSSEDDEFCVCFFHFLLCITNALLAL